MSATVSAVRSPCSVSPSIAETSPPRSRAWKRQGLSQRCGASLGDERNRGGEGDSRLERVRKLRERRRPGPLRAPALAPRPAQANGAYAPPIAPASASTATSTSDQTSRLRAPPRREPRAGREAAERQLALAHETAEASPSRTSAPQTAPAQRRATPAAKTSPSRKPAARPPETRNPRASLTGYGSTSPSCASAACRSRRSDRSR